MHDRPALRILHFGGHGIREISRNQQASRNAVRRALADGSRDTYYRPSATEEAEPAVRDVLADYPHMTVADIAVMIDWRHSRRQLSDLVARLRPGYLPGPGVEARDIAGIHAGTLRNIRNVATGTMAIGKLKLGEVHL